jgi:hypothetical protein
MLQHEQLFNGYSIDLNSGGLFLETGNHARLMPFNIEFKLHKLAGNTMQQGTWLMKQIEKT